jgi:tRNA pseudouridine65 synthase
VVTAASAPAALPILYLDDWLVVVNKPSGLLVHRSPVDRHERRFALQLLRDQLGERVYPVHRLDKPTSGALVFALDPATAQSLASQFENRLVEKRYVAVVRGWPDEQGLIEHPLDPVRDDRVVTAAGASKPALTRFRRLSAFELPRRVDRYPTSRYALLELSPQTGRRHQLRRHLAHVSHPIIGDTTYGKGGHNRLFAELFGSRRLLLACMRLAFRHPVSGSPLAVEAPLSADFDSILRQLGCPVDQ